MYHDNDKLKQSFILLVLFALGGFLFWYLKEFLSAFLGSVILYILLRRPFFYLTAKAKTKLHRGLIVALLMFISFMVVVLPILLVSLMLSGKINYVVHHYQDILLIAQDWSQRAQSYLNVDLLSQDAMNKLSAWATTLLPKFISAIATALVDIFVLYFILYFMLANSEALEKEVREMLPFKPENKNLLLRELKKQTIANSTGIFCLAIIQGLISFIGYAIFGVHNAGFWAVLTGIASAIPVIGTTVVWLPLCIIMYTGGREWQAIGAAIYSAVVLSISETSFRIIVLKKLGDVHPVITFFGVIMGVGFFGFVGIIFGPLLISYFILLLKIYSNEYLET